MNKTLKIALIVIGVVIIFWIVVKAILGFVAIKFVEDVSNDIIENRQDIVEDATDIIENASDITENITDIIEIPSDVYENAREEEVEGLPM